MATAAMNVKVEPADPDSWEFISEAASTVGLDDVVVAELALEEASSNPIGELQELCVSKKWPMPDYKEGPQTGPPHLPTFVITCRLNDLTFLASATSKKHAKKAAAAGMLEKVKRQCLADDARQQASVSREVPELENTMNQLAIGSGSAAPLMTAAEVETLLSTLAETSNVAFTSRADSDIEGRSVWLCELDGHVITGYGKTPQEARMDAAQGVVHRIRMKLLNQ